MKFTERRIIYDLEKFGDSPACIGKEKNLENQVALTQGFGITENTTDLAYFKPKLLETNVTLISNDDCYNKIRKARPCPFIQILSRFYPDFIQILSRFYQIF